jgi:hypothetical protein
MSLNQKIYDSYRNIFRFQIPELLAEKADRFHLYDFVIKLLIGFLFLIITPLITILPIYPILYLFITHKFSIQSALSGKIGEMNVNWLYLLYAYLILGIIGLQSGLDITFYSMFTSVFFILTPIMIALLWWYAEPVSIHDIFANIINEQRNVLPFANGGIAYSTMRCPADVNSHLESLTSQQGSGYLDSLKQVFGLSTSGIFILALTGLLFITTIIFILSMYIYPDNTRESNHKLNETHENTQTQTHKIILQKSS